VNCTIPPKKKTRKKTTNNTKQYQQTRFKIDSVWLQVALNVCSRPEALTILSNKKKRR